MESKKNNFMGDLYTSYGPFVGKVCENTNTQLYKDNIIESITSSITENSMNKDLLYEKSINLSVPVQEPNNIFKQSEYKTNNTIKKVKIPKQTNNINNNNVSIKKTGGEITKTLPELNNDIEDESTGFFNYKVSIFNFKISIWILILILLIIICIGYYIYKYWYLKNTQIITYKKSSPLESENNHVTNKNTDFSDENTTENTTSTTSSSSSNLTDKT